LFEIAEAVVAQLVSPELGTAYLGTQGDEWDAQNDMIAAFSGAFLTMMLVMIMARRTPVKQRYHGARSRPLL
jgi:putative membrane protein